MLDLIIYLVRKPSDQKGTPDYLGNTDKKPFRVPLEDQLATRVDLLTLAASALVSYEAKPPVPGEQVENEKSPVH